MYYYERKISSAASFPSEDSLETRDSLLLRSIKSKVSEHQRLIQIIATYWYRRVYTIIRVSADRYFPPQYNFKAILNELRKKYEVQSSNSLLKIEGEGADQLKLWLVYCYSMRAVLT